MNAEFSAQLFGALSRHRRSVLAGAAIVGLIGLAVSSRIELNEDLLAVLPQRDLMVDDYRYVVRKFRQIERVYFDVSADTGGFELLAAAADDLAAQLSATEQIGAVVYQVDASGGARLVDLIPMLLPNLITRADLALLTAKLEPDRVRDYLTAMRRRLGTLAGLGLHRIVASDPIGMNEILADKVIRLRTGLSDALMRGGRVVSGDGRHVLIVAQPTVASSAGAATEALVANLLRAARTIEREFPGIRVAMTGGHRMTVDNTRLLKADAVRCVTFGTLAMLLLCFSAFRRRWLALVTFLPTLFGGLMAGVGLVIWRPQLSGIAVGFGILAIGITVDYAIHIVYDLESSGRQRDGNWGRQLTRLVVPVSAGALTSIVAFAVLISTPMNGYQELGIFGAVGVFFSAAFALLVLPLLVPARPDADQRPLFLTQLLSRFYAWRSRRLPWLLLGVAALSLFAFGGLGRVRFEGDVTRLNGITEATRKDELSIRKVWGDALGMTLVVARGATIDEALAENDRIAELLDGLPGVVSAHSLSSILPSAATQATNRDRWRSFWSAERRAQLRSTIDDVGADLGFAPAAFAPFWNMVEGNPPLVTLESFRDTLLEAALNERLAFEPGDAAVSTLVQVDGPESARQLSAALAGPIVVDPAVFAEHIAGLAKSSLWRFALWTAAAVAVVLWVFLGSVELVFATLLPIAFGIVWTIGLMGWLGLPIDIMNSVFVVFIIGISEDYSVFLVTAKLYAWRGEADRLSAASAAVLISALTTLFGFAVLVFAQHPVLFSMGTTVLIGMVCALTATIVLTPLCMDVLLYRPAPTSGPRWWHLLGTLWVGLYLLIGQLIVLGVLLPLLKRLVPRRADATVHQVSRWAFETLISTFPFGRLERHGFDEHTFDEPAVVISNHQSAIDVLVMLSLSTDLRMTVKKRVWDTPILGIGATLLGHILVEPDKPNVTLARCRDRLTQGLSVHFFPEGTRSHDGFPIRFRRGAFELAVSLNQDIQPIVLCDTRTGMPRDAYWIQPYRATVRALPRVTPQTFDYSRGSLALMRYCERIVGDAFQTELDEINSPAILRRKVRRLYRYQGKFVEQFAYWKTRTDSLFGGTLEQTVPRSGLILDLGCGYGFMTHWLAETAGSRQLLGVDYDEHKIRVAQQTASQHRRVAFEVQDILEWDFPACDGIVLLDVLHYWRPEQQQRILRKAREALSGGGCMILRDDTAGDVLTGRRHWAERLATRVGHNRTVEGLHFQTRADLEGAVRQAGFSRVEVARELGRPGSCRLYASI